MLAAVALLAAATPLDAAVHAAIQPCPPPAADEITVCGRRDPDSRSPYLSPLPYELEDGDPRARSVARERYDLLDFDSGRANTCSTVGLGGQYGCQLGVGDAARRRARPARATLRPLTRARPSGAGSCAPVRGGFNPGQVTEMSRELASPAAG